MNQKGFANIILVVVVVVLLGAVGYFTLVKKSEPVAQQTASAPTASKTETPKQNANPTPAPGAETTSQLLSEIPAGYTPTSGEYLEREFSEGGETVAYVANHAGKQSLFFNNEVYAKGDRIQQLALSKDGMNLAYSVANADSNNNYKFNIFLNKKYLALPEGYVPGRNFCFNPEGTRLFFYATTRTPSMSSEDSALGEIFTVRVSDGSLLETKDLTGIRSFVCSSTGKLAYIAQFPELYKSSNAYENYFYGSAIVVGDVKIPLSEGTPQFSSNDPHFKLSPDGKLVAYSVSTGQDQHDSNVFVVNAQTGKIISKKLYGFVDFAPDMNFTNGKLYFRATDASADPEDIKQYYVVDGVPLSSPPNLKFFEVSDLAISQDEKTVAYIGMTQRYVDKGSSDRRDYQYYVIKNGKEVSTHKVIENLTMTPDGKTIIYAFSESAGDHSKTYINWDNKVIGEYPGYIVNLNLDPQGHFLYFIYLENNKYYLITASSGGELTRSQAFDTITNVHFSQDGTKIYYNYLRGQNFYLAIQSVSK